MQSFARSHPCSGCQWWPLWLTVLAVAPRTNKGLFSARLYDNMTNCSPTCTAGSYHRHMCKEYVCKVSQGRTHVQAANGGHTALQYLLLHQELTRGCGQRDTTTTWPTALLHVKLDNIIYIYIRSACAKLHKVAPMFRLPMVATLPYSTCCCTMN